MLIRMLLAAALAYGPGTGAPSAPSRADVAPSPNGLRLPEDFRAWQVLGVSHRQDNNTLRVILGNARAVRAVADGQTRPWPEGTILAKLVWKDASHAEWEMATVPGDFVHAEFMYKQGERFPHSGGWGFARWVGDELRPWSRDPEAAKACFGCHTPVANTDYVFTRPVQVPAVP